MTGSERARLEAALARVSVQDRQIGQLEAQLRQALEDSARGRKHELELEREVAALKARDAQWEARFAALEAKMMIPVKTSENSSAPPSTDSPYNQRHYPQRTKSGRKPGGQHGHPGVSVEFTHNPDEVHEYRPTQCAAGHALPESLPVISAERRQVIDVVVAKTVVEHRALDVVCPACHETVRGAFPAKVTGSVCYGDGVKTAALMAACGGLLPARPVTAMLACLYDVKVSTAAVDKWRQQLALSLDAWDDDAVQELRKSPVLGADETPIRIAGAEKPQIHVVQSPLLTRFHTARKDIPGIKAGGVLDGYAGTLTRDGAAAYRSVAEGLHQECWSHLGRALTFCTQAYTPGDKAAAHPWPQFQELATLASGAIHLRNAAARDKTGPPGSADVKAKFLAQLKPFLAEFDAAHPNPAPGTLARNSHNLLARMKRCYGDLWHFLDDLEVPPTNNASEQALRPWKVRQRRSGTFRSPISANQWLRIASYLDTARKHEYTAEEALRAAFAGVPIMASAPAKVAG